MKKTFFLAGLILLVTCFRYSDTVGQQIPAEMYLSTDGYMLITVERTSNRYRFPDNGIGIGIDISQSREFQFDNQSFRINDRTGVANLQ